MKTNKDDLHCVLIREYCEKYTKGEFLVIKGNAKIKYHSLELPDRNNQKNISCIPEGEYTVLVDSKGKLRLQTVLGRDGILIHAGNYIKDTEGCILLGKTIDKDFQEPTLYLTRLAIRELKNKLGNQRKFNLLITSKIK